MNKYRITIDVIDETNENAPDASTWELSPYEIVSATTRRLPAVEEIKDKIRADWYFDKNDRVTLSYADRGDKLSDEQVAEYITGEDFSSPLWDGVGESQSYQVWEILKPYSDDLTTEEEDELREWLWDSDDSDLIGELVRSHPGVVVTLIGQEVWSEDDDTLKAALVEQFAEWNLTVSDSDLFDMYANAGYGGEVTLRFSASVEDARTIYQEGGKLTITDPEAGYTDRLNGAGFMAPVSGTATVVVEPHDVLPENARGGYTWKEVACTYGLPGAVSIEKVEAIA